MRPNPQQAAAAWVLHKYQALGNDYLVLDATVCPQPPQPQHVQRLCDRHLGFGADGLLYGPLPAPSPAQAALQIFNADGSQAAKSGNGVRIFACFMQDQGYAKGPSVTLQTPSGDVTCHLQPAPDSLQAAQGLRSVTAHMGQVSFWAAALPMTGPQREVLAESLYVGGQVLQVYGVSVGNPHCVVPVPEACPQLVQRLGPLLECHPVFPQKTNVQCLQVLGPQAIRVEIWERGSGYTLSSGSSACACAAVAYRMGACRGPLQVHMPGGSVQVSFEPAYPHVTLCGPVQRVGTCQWVPMAQALLHNQASAVALKASLR
jgi:diaminopimelate epimerase